MTKDKLRMEKVRTGLTPRPSWIMYIVHRTKRDIHSKMRRPLVPKSTWIGMWIDYIKETWRELMVDTKRGTRENIKKS